MSETIPASCRHALSTSDDGVGTEEQNLCSALGRVQSLAGLRGALCPGGNWLKTEARQSKRIEGLGRVGWLAL